MVEKIATGVNRTTGGHYNGLAWWGLFSGHYAEAETALRRGLELDIVTTNPSGNWYILQTNLAPALLFQGKYAEARAKYLHLKDQPYPPRASTHPYYRDMFLKDIGDFEKEGVIPEARRVEVEEIKAMLKEGRKE